MTNLGQRESKVKLYEYDRLQTWVDWVGDPEELVRTNDEVDQKDHEAMYLEDYLDSMPDLEDNSSTQSTGTRPTRGNPCQTPQ